MTAKNTSIVLGNYFDQFVSDQIDQGRYNSASEVIRAALRMLDDAEQEKSRQVRLESALLEGIESGKGKLFDKDKILNNFIKNFAEENQ